ncbi:MAG: hypothetical protein K2N54_04425, partial [Helicobacter sp.]|nr:hypothetical protein [Helicobacter sp.]
YVMPFGSNIDVARCGWDYWNHEQWQILSLRASGASVAINEQRIPTRLIASLTLAMTHGVCLQ